MLHLKLRLVIWHPCHHALVQGKGVWLVHPFLLSIITPHVLAYFVILFFGVLDRPSKVKYLLNIC